MIITSGADTLHVPSGTTGHNNITKIRSSFLFDTTVSWEETDRDIQLASYQSKFSLKVTLAKYRK